MNGIRFISKAKTLKGHPMKIYTFFSEEDNYVDILKYALLPTSVITKEESQFIVKVFKNYSLVMFRIPTQIGHLVGICNRIVSTINTVK